MICRKYLAKGGSEVPRYTFTAAPDETINCGLCVYLETPEGRMPCRACAGEDLSSERSYFKQKARESRAPKNAAKA